MEEPLIQAVRMEKARADIGMALDLAAEYVKRFPDGTWRDEADYLVRPAPGGGLAVSRHRAGAGAV